MKKKSAFEKITNIMMVSSVAIIAFSVGFKMGATCQEKRGAAL